MVLNDLWQFLPVSDFDESLATGLDAPGWGLIRVPGSWTGLDGFPGIVKQGEGPLWEGVDGGLSSAWYRREVKIPETWEGRGVLLELARVSMDALVYVDGKPCGEVAWPGGTVDITGAVRPGRRTDISVFVTASAPTGQPLPGRGLLGDVVLRSRPAGTYIRDVFVRTSTRQREIALDVELARVVEPGTVAFDAVVLDAEGNEEQRFRARRDTQTGTLFRVGLSWPWPNPGLWDLDSPKLYTLMLRADGPVIRDEYRQAFGFREFWCEGQSFFLNGTRIRFRPNTVPDSPAGQVHGCVPLIDACLRGMTGAGFNLLELRPIDDAAPGLPLFRELWAERADVAAMPLIGALPRANEALTDGRWDDRLEARIRRLRNHPSVLMWVLSADLFGRGREAAPRRIGQSPPAPAAGPAAAAVEEATRVVKRLDPTRPVLHHDAGFASDVHAVTCYLNMLPLQEREEWLSAYAESGSVPAMAVEFGTPLAATLRRGREGGAGSASSEPWMTEFSAVYLGPAAYRIERNAYRQGIAAGDVSFEYEPAFQKLQALFIRNTWRSWRTTGIAGGMIPWMNGYGWRAASGDPMALGPFVPGRRGTHLDRAARALVYPFDPRGGTLLPAGRALLANNGPGLAWLAGPAGSPAAKDRNYRAGQQVRKQAVVLNDTRRQQSYRTSWEAYVRDRRIASGMSHGTLEPAGTRLVPITFWLPEDIAAQGGKASGEIVLHVSTAGAGRRDRFRFTVFGPPSPRSPAGTNRLRIRGGPVGRLLGWFARAQPRDADVDLFLYDPVGRTEAMLKTLGYSSRPFSRRSLTGLVIVGREALSSGSGMPDELEAFVREGGRAIVCAQDPEWVRNHWGLRVSRHLSRRAFPVGATHPVTAGLDAGELRDWAGVSTLTDAFPIYPPEAPPRYGWHWGNRGAVSSAPIEKPHLSSWRPLLECGFDLAYSPLLEMEFGRGRLLLCMLDLEDHASLDPAAERLARQLIEYARDGTVAAKASDVVYVGGEEGEVLLDRLGLVYDKKRRAPADAPLLILGPAEELPEETVRRCTATGGTVVLLPRRTAEAGLGVQLHLVEDFAGSLRLPAWPACRGLSASDLHWRAPHPVWLVASGAELGADGLVGRVRMGSGRVIFCQMGPDWFDVEAAPHMRLTRWRQTRALCQVLANLGARFKADRRVLRPRERAAAPLYLPDYVERFEDGDDPYRYAPW